MVFGALARTFSTRKLCTPPDLGRRALYSPTTYSSLYRLVLDCGHSLYPFLLLAQRSTLNGAFAAVTNRYFFPQLVRYKKGVLLWHAFYLFYNRLVFTLLRICILPEYRSLGV